MVMFPVLNLVRWEWFKLWRRWMPWILLAVAVCFALASLWARSASAGSAGSFADSFLLPNSIGLVLGFGNEVVAIAIIILTASTLGSEFGLGTFRGILSKGTERWQFLFSAFILMAAAGLVWLLAIFTSTVIVGFVAGFVAGDGGFATAGQWPAAFAQLGKSALAFVPYIAVTMCCAVLTTSATAALGIALAYKFVVEGVVVTLLASVGNGFDTAASFVLGQAVRGWLASGGGNGEPTGGFVFGGSSGTLEAIPGLLVMLAYTLALMGVTVWVFQRRDIEGARAA